MKRKMLNGYWIVYVPDYSGCMRNKAYKGWEYEHKYLMEISIGRTLADDEIVHHIDNNRLNNSLENLQLMKRSEHASLHERERGHGTVNRCIDCGKQINYRSTRCKHCNDKYKYGSERPSKQELEKLIKSYNNTQIASMYGVSDTAVGKWRKKHGLPSWNSQHEQHRGIKTIESVA